MRLVRSKDTAPELTLRSALHGAGLRYRLHDRRLPGKPDLVLPRFSAVILVHGCFWHAHGCRRSSLPATRTETWSAKFAANRARDERVVEELQERGWRVLVVWECALDRGKSETVPVADVVRGWLESGEDFGELG